MNEPFEGFWNRLKTFVENVQVNDAMSEEEKGMILHTCNEQTNVKNLVQPDVRGRSQLLAAFFDYIKGEVPLFRLKDINTQRAVNDFLSRQ